MTENVARGDKRRSALLESLDHYLRDGSREWSLDSINIAGDVLGHAGTPCRASARARPAGSSLVRRSCS